MNGLDKFVEFLNGIKERGDAASEAVEKSDGDPQSVSDALELGLEDTLRSSMTPMFSEEDRSLAEEAANNQAIIDKMKDGEALAERLGKFIAEGL